MRDTIFLMEMNIQVADCWVVTPYEGVSKSFRTESITKYTFTFGVTHWEATQSVMATKLTRLAHKIAVQLLLVAESCTICSSRARWPVRKLLGTPSYSDAVGYQRFGLPWYLHFTLKMEAAWLSETLLSYIRGSRLEISNKYCRFRWDL
jgi:hypothetical protein